VVRPKTELQANAAGTGGVCVGELDRVGAQVVVLMAMRLALTRRGLPTKLAALPESKSKAKTKSNQECKNMTRFMKAALIASVLMLGSMLLAQQKEEPVTPQAPAAPAAAAPAPAAKTTGEFAYLRVYRQRRYVGSALAPSIYLDDKQIARVGNGRRFSMRLLPGSHTVRSDDKSSAITVDAKAGQEYYVRVEEATGFWKGHGKLTLVMPEQGSPEYKLQKPVEEDRKVAKELIEEDTETAKKDQ